VNWQTAVNASEQFTASTSGKHTTIVEKWGEEITHSPLCTILSREAYSFTLKIKETGFSEKFVAIY
jgi:hypothetical protein